MHQNAFGRRAPPLITDDSVHVTLDCSEFMGGYNTQDSCET